MEAVSSDLGRRRVRCILLATLSPLVLLVPAASASSPAARAGQRPVLYLVAFDRGSGQLLPGLARTARRRGLQVRILHALRPPPAAFDAARKQWIAEALIGEFQRSHPRLRAPGAVVIGLTGGDMYIRGLSWRYAFGARGAGNVGMIATRRMDPRFFHLGYDSELFRSRLDKMFVRYLGFLVLRLPTNRNQFSVLRASILSLDELDLMTNEFTPAPPSARERRWIAGSNASCAQARVATYALGLRHRMTLPQLVRAAGGVLRIQERLLARLRAQHGRPLDRALAIRFFGRFAAFKSRERSALADLRADPDAVRAGEWISVNVRARATLRVFTLRLRLLGCAAYFVSG
jgi:predicted Zn-dependent protease